MIEAGTVQNGLKLMCDDLGLDNRRLAVGLADDRGVRRHRTPFSIASTRAAGMLATTKRLPRLPVRSAQPHGVGAKLRQPRLRRNIQRAQRGLVDHAVGMQAVADLEAAQRGVDKGIEHLRVAGIGLEVAGDRQPRAQRRHGRALDADAELATGHFRPAALGDDRLILRDRGLGGFGCRRRQRRQRLLRQFDGAGGVVESAAEIGILILPHQLVQHLVGRLTFSGLRQRTGSQAGAGGGKERAAGERCRHPKFHSKPPLQR